MTLSELIDHVCTNSHRPDQESQDEARKYIRNRYRILWNTRLWRDAIDTILLEGTRLLNEFGEPILDQNGNFITTGLIDQIVILPAVVSRIISCRWVNTTLEVEEMSTVFRTNPQAFNEVGDPLSFSIIAPAGVPQQPGGRALRLRSSSPDATYTVSVRGMLGNVDQTEVIILAGNAQVSSFYSYDTISSLAKTSRSEDLEVQDDLGTTLMNLPREESQRLHQRIHFHRTPRTAGSLFVLYKRRCRDLYYDSDCTEVEEMDNMLIAAAMSDMKAGGGEYSKAAAKSQEVATLMDIAIRLEREQSASNPRIIPWDGGGYDQIETQSKGYW
jgi:hypothetical protein